MKTVLLVSIDSVQEFSADTWLDAVSAAVSTGMLQSHFEPLSFAIVWKPDGFWKVYHLTAMLDSTFC